MLEVVAQIRARLQTSGDRGGDRPMNDPDEDARLAASARERSAGAGGAKGDPRSAEPTRATRAPAASPRCRGVTSAAGCRSPRHRALRTTPSRLAGCHLRGRGRPPRADTDRRRYPAALRCRRGRSPSRRGRGEPASQPRPPLPSPRACRAPHPAQVRLRRRSSHAADSRRTTLGPAPRRLAAGTVPSRGPPRAPSRRRPSILASDGRPLAFSRVSKAYCCHSRRCSSWVGGPTNQPSGFTSWISSRASSRSVTRAR